jgi:hypothetical protein
VIPRKSKGKSLIAINNNGNNTNTTTPSNLEMTGKNLLPIEKNIELPKADVQ